MTPELKVLTYITLFQAIMWIPYIVNTIAVRGLVEAVGYPQTPKPLAAWATRMKAAHYNAVENLVLFATLVLVAHAAGVSNDTTVLACTVYFWARVAHFLFYTLAVPWMRTLSFTVAWACLMVLGWQIIG